MKPIVWLISQEKKKEKIVEDKTFGLKNKNKSKKVQAYVNQGKFLSGLTTYNLYYVANSLS
jgi:hypothetical protein